MSTTQLESQALSQEAFDQLFFEARTYNAWQSKPVPTELIHQLYDTLKFAPTSANTSPARFVFLTTEDAKARLLPAMAPLNVEKTATAPVVAIIAYDTVFYDQLPKLFPHADARAWFAGNPDFAHETAFRNSSLQGAYLLLAARALGLDAGPMSGFDSEKVNAEFFPDGKFKVNFIVNLGYGDQEKLFPRSPRLEFNEAASIL